MSRVLVTGTSGFIASHLARLLVERGDTVLGLDKREPLIAPAGWSHVTCDLLNASALALAVARFAPDTVLHLAARTDLDETKNLSGYAANIEGVRNLATAIRACGSVQRTVCTSSQLVNRIGYAPISDSDYSPATLYGASKVETERIWRAEAGGGADWTIVRPTTIWGPRMNPHYLRFFRMIAAGRYRHLSGGPRFKSYGYVGNTVWEYFRIAIASRDQVHGKVFYLADYEPIALERWADEFQLQLRAPPIRSIPLVLARAAAAIGDGINAVGFKRFPLNSFRLHNVLTCYTSPLETLECVVGPLPYSMAAGVAETCVWLREVL